MDHALQRVRQGRVVAGVVGGLARRFGIDPFKARVGYVLLSVLSAAFPGILVYLVFWFVMDAE